MMESEKGWKDWCLGAVKSVAGLEGCVCPVEGKQLMGTVGFTGKGE